MKATETQVVRKLAICELVEDSQKKMTATEVRMTNNAHDEQLVEGEAVLDDLDELEDMEDNLEPIICDPSSVGGFAQMEWGYEERMEVMITGEQQEQQLADDEIEQVEAPKTLSSSLSSRMRDSTVNAAQTILTVRCVDMYRTDS